MTPILFGGRILGTAARRPAETRISYTEYVSTTDTSCNLRIAFGCVRNREIKFSLVKDRPLRNLELFNNNNVPHLRLSTYCYVFPLCHSSNSASLLHVIGQTSSFLVMARFLFLLIACLFFAVGKPQNSFPSAPEPGVLAQQLSGTAGAGSIPLPNSDGKVPDSQLQDVDGNAISFQDPSSAESAITENSLNPSSALIASAPNSCSNPASKLRKRQNPLEFFWNGIRDLPFLNLLKSPPSDHSFCPNSPDALTRGGGSSAPKPGPEAATQDGQPIDAPKPRPGVVNNQPKKGQQQTTQKGPEPMVSGPEGPSCPYDYPQKVCCRGELKDQLVAGFGVYFDQCWDCELLQLTL